jgi:hypothetical protein
MKKFILLLFIFAFAYILVQSCGENPKTETVKPKRTMQSFEMRGRDTMNWVDGEGLKQGHWEVWKAYAFPEHPKDVEQIKFEEGEYLNNKKEGLWKYYNPDGTVKDSVVYKNDVVAN